MFPSENITPETENSLQILKSKFCLSAFLPNLSKFEMSLPRVRFITSRTINFIEHKSAKCKLFLT